MSSRSWLHYKSERLFHAMKLHGLLSLYHFISFSSLSHYIFVAFARLLFAGLLWLVFFDSEYMIQPRSALHYAYARGDICSQKLLTKQQGQPGHMPQCFRHSVAFHLLIEVKWPVMRAAISWRYCRVIISLLANAACAAELKVLFKMRTFI